MKRKLTKYDTADQYLYNITELGKMFDLSRDTVRRRLSKFKVISPEAKSGNAVYVLREAAQAILAFEDRMQ